MSILNKILNLFHKEEKVITEGALEKFIKDNLKIPKENVVERTAFLEQTGTLIVEQPARIKFQTSEIKTIKNKSTSKTKECDYDKKTFITFANNYASAHLAFFIPGGVLSYTVTNYGELQVCFDGIYEAGERPEIVSLLKGKTMSLTFKKKEFDEEYLLPFHLEDFSGALKDALLAMNN